MGWHDNVKRFILEDTTKYVGDPTKIITRSSWEYAYCSFLARNKNVARWNSEEIVIPYISPIDKKTHRYYVDFWVKFTNGKTMLVEIKPHTQTLPPKPPKRNTQKTLQNYRNQLQTYAVNQAKWEAARLFAAKNNSVFVVFTEHTLEAIGIRL